MRLISKMPSIVFFSFFIFHASGCMHDALPVPAPTVISQPENQSIIQEHGHPAVKDLGGGWLEVTGQAVIENITPGEANKRAIQDACQAAIEYYSGVTIRNRTLDIQAESRDKILLDHFSSLSNYMTEGIVLEKVVLRDEVNTDGRVLVKNVFLKVKVGRQKGEPDPYFKVEAGLNREYFKEGDKLELTVKSSRDCYITILNICSNDSVYLMFPNQYQMDNFLKAGDLLILPGESGEEAGLSFGISLLPGKDEDTEMIKILATKEKLGLLAFTEFSAYNTYRAALADLQKALIEVPRSEIAEVDLVYFIVK